MHQPINDRDQVFPTVDVGTALRHFLDVLSRNWGTIARLTLALVVAAAAYALSAQPHYTSQASILIDPRTRSTPDGPEPTPFAMNADALIVDSEVQVLQSREVTARAARALGLFETEPEPPGALSRLADTVRGWIAGDTAADETPDATTERLIREERIRTAFVRELEIERSAETYVISIEYTHPDRDFAADAVNAVVDAYLQAATARRSSEFDRLNAWIGDRLDRVDAEVRAAEGAVADFRSDNQLFLVNGDRLPSQVELGNATDTLIATRNQIVALGVKIDQLDAQIASGDPEGVSVAPEDRTVALQAFEQRYAELLEQEMTQILSRGEGSAVVTDLRRTQAEIRGLILDELTRIRERLVSQRATLQRRADETQDVIETLRVAADADAQKLIELRRLERQAASKRLLFEDLLTGFDNSAELASFDGSPARVIAAAVPADEKSAPRTALLVLLAGFGGLAGGIILAFTREAFDSTLRTPEDLRDLTGLTFMGVVPAAQSERKRMKTLGLATGRPSEAAARLPRKSRILRFAADHPRSIMAETLRALLIQLSWVRPSDQRGGPVPRGVSVGFLSSVADEGKTTVAANFATLLAAQSARVILVDLDLMKSATTRALAGVLPEANSLSALMLDPEGTRPEPIEALDGLTVIGNAGQTVLDPADPLDAEDLEDVIALLKERYDYVVLDIPPLQGPAESRVLARLCDRLVFLVHWGLTDSGELSASLRTLRGFGDRLIGAIFTRADLQRYLKYNRNAIKGAYYS